MTRSTASVLAKAVSLVAGLTVIGKVLGFFREASIAAVFGATSDTDAFLIAQTVPLVLFTVVSYALTTTFIPVYSHVRENEGKGAAFQFANTVIWTVVLVGLLLVLLGQIFANSLIGFIAPGFGGDVSALAAYLSRIMFPMMIFRLLSGVMNGILQADGKFTVPTAASLVQNIMIIAATVCFGPSSGIVAVAIGTLAGAICATCLKAVAIVQVGFRWRRVFNLADPSLRRMLVMMLPAILAAGATEINVVVDRILASGLPQGRIAALNYANRLMQLAPGIIGTSAITVLYPTLSKFAAKGSWKEFGAGVGAALSLLHFLLMPIAVGAMVLREPLIQIVFERGAFDALATQETAWAFQFFSLAIAIVSMRNLISRAFFALHDTKTPMLLGFVTVGANIALNLLFVGPLEQGGLALASSSAALIGLCLGIVALNRKLPGCLDVRSLMNSAFRIWGAACVMGVVVLFAHSWLESAVGGTGTLPSAVRIAGASGVGTVSYILLSRLFRIREIQLARSMVQRLLRSRAKYTVPGATP